MRPLEDQGTLNKIDNRATKTCARLSNSSCSQREGVGIRRHNQRFLVLLFEPLPTCLSFSFSSRSLGHSGIRATAMDSTSLLTIPAPSTLHSMLFLSKIVLHCYDALLRRKFMDAAPSLAYAAEKVLFMMLKNIRLLCWTRVMRKACRRHLLFNRCSNK